MKLGSLVSEIQLENKLGDEFADIGDELAHKLKDELENQDEINEVVIEHRCLCNVKQWNNGTYK